MFFWNKICGILAFFLLVAFFSYGQRSTSFHFLNDSLLRLKSPDHYVLTAIARKEDPDWIIYFPVSFSDKKKISKTIPSDFSVCNYGFFCRQELKIEKASKVAIRIRLGSLEQCDFYEGKH